MIPEGWSATKFGNIANIFKGVTYKSEHYDAAGKPFITLKCIGKGGGFKERGLKYYSGPFKREHITEAGDILIANTDLTRDGDVIGAPVFVPTLPGECIFSMDLSRIEILKAIAVQKFIYYSLCSETARQFMKENSSGSTVLHLSLKSLPNLNVLLPPLPEQRAIAEILDSVDATISATEATLAQTRRVKQALLQQLLTKGIDENGRPHTKFKMTEIGLIPEAWEVISIGDVAEVGNGSTPLKSNEVFWRDGHIPWVASGKVNERIVFEPTAYITPQALAKCPLRLLPVETVIVAMIGEGQTRGRTSILGIEAAINQNLAYIVANRERLVPVFLLELLRFQYEPLRALGRGSNQAALNCGLIKKFKIPLPPLEEQQVFSKLFDKVDSLVTTEKQAEETFQSLKRALMRDLLTGRVRVKDIKP
jgi:type I restriction enzyme, S subunit